MPTYENVKYLTLPQQVEKNRTDIQKIQNDSDKYATNDRVDNIIAEIAENVDGVSAAEIVDARKGKSLLGDKIEEIDTIIAENAGKFELQNWELQNKIRKVRPIISFVDDDGSSKVMNKIYPLMQTYGIPYVFAIPTHVIGQSGRLTVENMNDLVAIGGEISSHTNSWDDLTTLTKTEIENSLSTSKEILNNLGFEVDTICYPQGGVNDDIVEIARKYYRFGRKTNYKSMINGSPLETFDALVTPLGSYFETITEAPYDTDTLDYYKYMVDKAVSENGWLIFMTHCAASQHDEDQQTYLEQTIQYIQSLNIPILSFKDALNERANIVDIGRYWINDITKEHFVIGCDGKSSGNWLQSNYKVLPANTYTLSNQPGDFNFGSIINIITSTTNAPETSTGILTSTMVSASGNYDYGYVRQEYKLTEKNTTYVRYSLNSVSWSDWQLLNSVVVYPNNSRNFNSSINDFQVRGISYVRMTLNEAGSPLNFGGGLLITNRTAGYEQLQYQEFVGENNPERFFRRHWTGSVWGDWLRITPVALTTAQRNSANFQRNIGDQVFDTTLGVPVWWNGSNWVDSTGTAV